MFEKVNPAHPDKIADRIAGALVDLAYRREENPRIAVEVQIGHGTCNIMAEASVAPCWNDVKSAVERITGRDDLYIKYDCYKQDRYLADNQKDRIRCGDNGIFRGVPVTTEQRTLTDIARNIYAEFPYDGKYIMDAVDSGERSLITSRLVICQSNAGRQRLTEMYPIATINPLGDWTGGFDVDTGMTNRKIGSDLGDSATGGGLCGKDVSKPDVSVTVYAWLKAQQTGRTIELNCAIGDEYVGGIPYDMIVGISRKYIEKLGGFEKLAEWGLIR